METKYYSNELEDDFADVKRKEKIVDEKYVYINRNIFWNILAFICYRMIMSLVAFFYTKCCLHTTYKNKKLLRKIKGGYFLYANHTQIPGDGYFPTVLTFPKKPYVVVNPDSIALKGTEQFMKMIGAFPTPSNTSAMKNFLKALEERVQKNVVMIYPEAHIWPYYTQIRKFKDISFKYPVKFRKPAFCFTVTYQKRKVFKKPKITVYVDGPFYPNEDLNIKEQQSDLCERIYQQMVFRSKMSNYEYVRYVKRSDEND